MFLSYQLVRKWPVRCGDRRGGAAKYSRTFRRFIINWKLSKRVIIPNDRHFVEVRRSALAKLNRNARHPFNAMLNYGYAVIQAEIKMQIIAEGLDPTIGISHSVRKYRGALVFDRMEPLRPLVDKLVLDFLFRETLFHQDFIITNDGFCRLNSQLVRRTVQALASIAL